MLIVVLLATAPVWARLFGYKGRPKPAPVSRNRSIQATQTGPDWEQDIPWVLGE